MSVIRLAARTAVLVVFLIATQGCGGSGSGGGGGSGGNEDNASARKSSEWDQMFWGDGSWDANGG